MIKLLECTLRDGGYINDWNFTYPAIINMIAELEKTNVDILELGFLKNEPYNKDRTVFNSADQITALIPNKKTSINYAAMIEVVNPIPLEMVAERTPDGIDTIRVIVWKTKHDKNGDVVDALEEGYNYCKGIVEKGYNLCVQPARVDQYTDEEFIAMVNKFASLNPLAVYVVDSWGTQYSSGIMHYVHLADKYLPKEIAIGFHGHNNMMQAFDTATTFIHSGLDRDLIVDASVYGMGRGAGNLNVELIAAYMNKALGKNYKIEPFVDIHEKYIEPLLNTYSWGYSIPYFLTARYNCNPNYGSYYGLEKKLPTTEIEGILRTLSKDDKVMFTKDKADFYQRRYEESQNG